MMLYTGMIYIYYILFEESIEDKIPLGITAHVCKVHVLYICYTDGAF